MRPLLALILFLTASLTRADTVILGNFEVKIPQGWSLTDTQDNGDRLIYRSPDKMEGLTLSLLQLRGKPSRKDFEALCHLRLRVERTPGCLVNGSSDVTKNAFSGFQFKFVGQEPFMQRIFSGLLTTSDDILFTAYYESLRLKPKTHLDTFDTITKGISKAKGPKRPKPAAPSPTPTPTPNPVPKSDAPKIIT